MRALGYFRLTHIPEASRLALETSFLRYCRDQEHQVVSTFTDTAAAPDGIRSQYASMIDYIRSSRSEFLILVPDASHLGKDLEEVTRSMVELEGLGARITCVKSDIPDPLQNAFHLLGVKGLSRNRSEKIKKAMIAKAIRGKALGRPAYGYRIGPDGDLETVDQESATVELIFRLYTTDGLGIRLIAQYLNQNCILGRHGIKWSIVAIRGVLRNPVYIGIYARFGLHLFSNHPGIVSHQVFRRAQNHMKERRPRKRKIAPECFPLSGLTYCGYCGNKMIGVTRRRSWKRKNREEKRTIYRYYQCQSRTNQSSCQFHTWQASLLESTVVHQLYGLLRVNPSLLDGIVSSTTSTEESIAAAEQSFLRAFKKTAQGIMTMKRLGYYLKALDARRMSKESAKQAVEDRIFDSSLLSPEKWISLDSSLQHSLLAQLINRVIVKDEGIELFTDSATRSQRL